MASVTKEARSGIPEPDENRIPTCISTPCTVSEERCKIKTAITPQGTQGVKNTAVGSKSHTADARQF
jgi:hypothetical protein